MKKPFKLSKNTKLVMRILLVTLLIILSVLLVNLGIYQYNLQYGRYEVDRLPVAIDDNYKHLAFEVKENNVPVFKELVYDNMTLEQVITQINKSLNSTLKGTGEIFVTKSLEKGIDPYVAVAISLYETGCKWECSYLVKECYNIGGLKGNPGCDGGSFKKYNTLEEGIDAYLNTIESYYKAGMDTPEKMEYRYSGGSTTWANKVNNYIKEIKSK